MRLRRSAGGFQGRLVTLNLSGSRQNIINDAGEWCRGVDDRRIAGMFPVCRLPNPAEWKARRGGLLHFWIMRLERLLRW